MLYMKLACDAAGVETAGDSANRCDLEKTRVLAPGERRPARFAALAILDTYSGWLQRMKRLYNGGG
jgi:hypothetical protein